MQSAIDELVQHYFDNPDYTIESVPFGLTNLTRIVRINGGGKYVVRIYNRHTKTVQNLESEAKITSYLSCRGLSFQVPVFLRSRKGDEYVRLSDGSLGAIVSFLEGTVPELAGVREAVAFGRVVGEISSALGRFEVEQLEDRGKSFPDFYALHPLAHRQAVASFIENPPFPVSEERLRFYREMVSSVEKSVDRLQGLPCQLVHHDVLIFNLLAQNGHIQGVLDFDFTSVDYRFMEFAICLNHIIHLTDGCVEKIDAFIGGYAEYGRASRQECKHVQLMTRIYHLAVLHIYIGQHYAGANIEKNFLYILDQFLARDSWLTGNGSILSGLFEKYFHE